MRILITGVAGHLGSSLARWIRLTHKGTEIIGVDDMSCGYRENAPDGIELHECRVSALEPALFERPFDATFHFAAYAAECLSPFVRRFNYDNNVCETASLVSKLIDGGGRHGRLVFTSSAAVYGAGGCPFDEAAPCQPHDPYGVAKLACELDLRVASQQHGLDWCVVRPHNIYGPGQSIWQRYRNVVGLWMRAILEDQPIVIFGDGTQQRAFTYIDEIVPCLWRAAFSHAASRQIINLGGSEPTTINNLVDVVRNVTGATQHQVDRQPSRHEVKRVWCTVSRSMSLLGYREYMPLDEGLRRMWEWSQEAWTAFPARREHDGAPLLETRSRLPQAWTNAH